MREGGGCADETEVGRGGWEDEGGKAIPLTSFCVP